MIPHPDDANPSPGTAVILCCFLALWLGIAGLFVIACP